MSLLVEIIKEFKKLWYLINRKHCQGCGKLLVSKKSRETGYGNKCIKKIQGLKYKTLEDEGQLRLGEK